MMTLYTKGLRGQMLFKLVSSVFFFQNNYYYYVIIIIIISIIINDKVHENGT